MCCARAAPRGPFPSPPPWRRNPLCGDARGRRVIPWPIHHPPSGPTCDLAVHVLYVTLATAYAQGLRNGTAAAKVDNPYFLGDHALIAAAWEVSRARSGMRAMRPLAEQEEYFVAWVHGYVVRAEQIEDAPAVWGPGTRRRRATIPPRRSYRSLPRRGVVVARLAA